ncbi:hypothetical protein P9A10_25330 [Serratia marcescens]|uniref:hypothetical protein n=1 Tax=Serratia marcescens TaxID=615 RepID=UPI0032049A21
MRLSEISINQLVITELGQFTDGAKFSSEGVAIILNTPDGARRSIWGDWKHMSDPKRLADRLLMLQHAIYEEYTEYSSIPSGWAR